MLVWGEHPPPSWDKALAVSSPLNCRYFVIENALDMFQNDHSFPPPVRCERVGSSGTFASSLREPGGIPGGKA